MNLWQTSGKSCQELPRVEGEPLANCQNSCRPFGKGSPKRNYRGASIVMTSINLPWNSCHIYRMYIERGGMEGEIGGYIKFHAKSSKSSKIVHFSQEFQQFASHCFQEFQQLRKDYE